VVWKDERDGKSAIFEKNLETGEEALVYQVRSPDRLGRPVVSEEYIVWVHDRGVGAHDVFAQSRLTGGIAELSDDGPQQASPTIPAIWKDTVVWMSWHTGNGDIYGVTLDQASFMSIPPTSTPVLPAPMATLTLQPTAPPLTQTPSPERTPARIVEVIDGDTIKVNIAGSVCIVRYIGVDAPEITWPMEWMGPEAAEANRRLVEDETVYLEKDISETDQYGWLLRYVFLEDGTFVNARLLQLGYAKVSIDHPDVRYRELLLQTEREARELKRGLWGPTPTPTTVVPTTVKATSTPHPAQTPAHDIELFVGVDDYAPPPLTWVCVRGRILVDGKPARGVTMKTTWHYKEWDDDCTAITNGTPDNPGIASCCLSSGPFQGYTVKVDVVFTYEGKNYGTPVEFLVK
jgi:endonuclease YncB( thermonuclease family)